jgi:hypothetical protein
MNKFVRSSVFLVSIILVVGNTPTQATSIKAGTVCSDVGAEYKVGKSTFVCTKVKTKLVWVTKVAIEQTFIMPRVVGMNLQYAQDLLQSLGSYLMRQEDASGLGRIQILDRNWKVCRQFPFPGKKSPLSTIVILGSVKNEEKCP